MEVVDESASKQRITSASFRKNQHYGKKWNAADTSKFLKAVQYFGSDFTILSPLFPNLTRRHLKSKFSLEDRKNPGRVSYSVSRPVPPRKLLSPLILSESSQRLRSEKNF
ncbi:hypothetical protein DFJ73DRAFT_246551 [Zopfochytrium polystomum]|nr:hypothetical protein DFJ73DRAFT_246551 [Zopfochytrium polystomum]